jgi:hypothetical protein
MTVSTSRVAARPGRPSNADLLQREEQARLLLVRLLVRALQHLNHPSRLADSPLCQLEGVRQQAAGLRGYRYPRARIVIEAVRQAYELAWSELGETADAGCLAALADALRGLSREESARTAGVSPTEISRRRREAVDMIADHVLTLLNGP